jgi:hypothetical protein
MSAAMAKPVAARAIGKIILRIQSFQKRFIWFLRAKDRNIFVARPMFCFY